jgi:hypothetical protein
MVMMQIWRGGNNAMHAPTTTPKRRYI